MAEFGGAFPEYEADFEHDFANLAERVRLAYAELDVLAHRDGSEHHDKEVLTARVDIDGQRREFYFGQLQDGCVKINIYDMEGQPLYYWSCNIKRDEQPKGGMSQAERMLVVAGTLEQTYHEIMRTGAPITPYVSEE